MPPFAPTLPSVITSIRAETAYHQAEKDYAAGKISEESLFLRKSEYEAAKLFAEEGKQRLATV
jgi:hypothetical protein